MTFENFKGFSDETLKFFSSLEKNNSTEWFHKNRDRYDNYIVNPSKALVNELAPFFQHINPSIRTEPKFNQTLMRINKDMRFAKDAPYRNYFLIHFGRFKMDSEFYLYINKEGFTTGMFLNNGKGENLFFNKNLQKYKNEIIEVSKKLGVEGKINLFTFKKSNTEKIMSNFKMEKNINLLDKLEFILLEKEFPPKSKTPYQPKLTIELIKLFSKLYPLYCFAIFNDPLKQIELFEERVGIVQ